MTKEGQRGHTIGCQCLDCYTGRETDKEIDRLRELGKLLARPMRSTERDRLMHELRGLQAKLKLP